MSVNIHLKAMGQTTTSTAKGAMKDLSAEMAKEYFPKQVECNWYQWWESSGFFKPSDASKKFVIVFPPPNVTGALHIGHALTGAVQDTLIRYHRMMGHSTLFLPGTDHAGIATQVVVEKTLKKHFNKSRHDFGREEFLKHVWAFKAERSGFIQNQMRMLGLSCDWTRERFTMDEQCGKAVLEGFVQMHERKLIYRATRMVNWCCALQSAISDLEVEFDDIEKNSKVQIPNYDKKVDMGMLTQVAYKVVGSNEEIVIATTRPETILGDTGVAVHPEDPRYKHLHGKRLQCPFRDGSIPIICDPTLVDMNFGTGAVKITPAHDPNDFECGQRHKLDQIVIFDLKGFIIMDGEFHGMHRFDCRKAVVAALEKKELFRGAEGYTHRVGRCQRTGDIVEPMVMPQWFVDCSEMAAESVKAVEEDRLRITPPEHKVTWFNWLRNIKPWCISRQLWWGHRIPAYKVTAPFIKVPENESWVVGRNLEEAALKAKEQFKLTDEQMKETTLQQDPDVLDTWFSSGLWPFSVMGWPEKTADMNNFFPGSLLETGHDILFFWVARMVMMSICFTGQLPFHDVYLHAMVRDKEGRKMSKSLGNVIDPMDVINGIELKALREKLTEGTLDPREIEKATKYQAREYPKGIDECGSDALRFGLLTYTCSGRDVNLDIKRVVGYRQFCNKLWNVSRFCIFFSLGLDFKPIPLPPTKELPLECQWILSRLEAAITECHNGFTDGQYDFAQTTTAVYQFWLYELCDVFLELIKPIMQRSDPSQKKLHQSVLFHCVETGLRLLHPMMPYVTEELWHRLPNADCFSTKSIMLAAYPVACGNFNPEVEQNMKIVLDIVHGLRSLKASYQLTNKQKPDVWVTCTESALAGMLSAQACHIQTLSVVGNVILVDAKESEKIPKGCGINVISPEVAVHVMLKDLVDVDREILKLEKSIGSLTKQLDTLSQKMSQPTYEEKVPADIKKVNAEKKEALNQEIKQSQMGIEHLKEMRK